MASSGYAAMELPAQVALMQQENALAGAVTAKGQMWKTALAELTQCAESMGKATDAIEPAWTDQAGAKFVGDTRTTKSGVDTFARNIETAKPDAALDAVVKGIADTFKIVQENQQKAQQALAAAMAASPGANAAALKEQIEKPFREANGQAMDSLDQLWDAAASAVQAAAGGGQAQASATGAGPGAGGQAPGGGGAGGGGTGGQQGAGAGQQGAAQQGAGADQQGAGAAQQGAGDQGAGAGQQGAGDQAAGLQNAAQPQDPGLAGGLGTAPVTPPTVAPTVPPTVPPVAQVPGTGFVPVLPGAGAGANPGVNPAVNPSRVVPGVGIGGSAQNSIPAAAAPISSPAVPTSGAAPAAPGATGAPTTGTTGGGGAVPPMVPPMGAGMGGGARSGGFGSGAATRPGATRRRQGATPGLPSMLSGKAGKANPDAFVAVRRRNTNDDESDIPTTVQLIDEDLWQVPEVATPPTSGPQRRR